MYQLTIDEHTQAQLDALPTEGQQAWRELRATLELAPWNGEPLHPHVPEGVLSWQFGPHREGLAYYLVVEHARQVAVLEVLWLARRAGRPPMSPAAPAADHGRLPGRR